MISFDEQKRLKILEYYPQFEVPLRRMISLTGLEIGEGLEMPIYENVDGVTSELLTRHIRFEPFEKPVSGIMYEPPMKYDRNSRSGATIPLIDGLDESLTWGIRDDHKQLIVLFGAAAFPVHGSGAESQIKNNISVMYDPKNYDGLGSEDSFIVSETTNGRREISVKAGSAEYSISSDKEVCFEVFRWSSDLHKIKSIDSLAVSISSDGMFYCNMNKQVSTAKTISPQFNEIITSCIDAVQASTNGGMDYLSEESPLLGRVVDEVLGTDQNKVMIKRENNKE